MKVGKFRTRLSCDQPHLRRVVDHDQHVDLADRDERAAVRAAEATDAAVARGPSRHRQRAGLQPTRQRRRRQGEEEAPSAIRSLAAPPCLEVAPPGRRRDAKSSPHADMRTPFSPKLSTHCVIRTAGAAELASPAMHAGDTDGISPLPRMSVQWTKYGDARAGDGADENLLIRIWLERPELIFDRGHRDQHALVLRRNAPGQRHDVGGVSGGRQAGRLRAVAEVAELVAAKAGRRTQHRVEGRVLPWCRTGPILAGPSNRLRSSRPRRTGTLRAAGTPGSRRGRRGRRRPGRARRRRAAARSRSPIRRAARCTRTRPRSLPV